MMLNNDPENEGQGDEDDLQSFTVKETGRIDKVLAGLIPELSRSRLKSLILDGQVCLNDAVLDDPSHKVSEGDRLTLFIPPPVDALPKPENIPLDIVYEDDDLIVLNKPAGMVVHPAVGNRDGTLVSALLYHCGESLSGIGGVKRPGIVHRLDKDTSGLMLVAKNDMAHKALADQLADRSLHRVYHALAWKEITPIKGTINLPIGRHTSSRLKMSVRSHASGREAITHYLRLETFGKGFISHVQCRLETGRTHQIRVHLQHLGHPLLGDSLYGLPAQEQGALLNRAGYDAGVKQAVMAFPRQALHAKEIAFIHPRSGEEMDFETDFPADFQGLYDLIKVQ
jgi:23S rRNA pseudouridine1911/1915/1917 synthase